MLSALLVLAGIGVLFAGGGSQPAASSGGKEKLLIVAGQWIEQLLTGQGVAASKKNVLEGLKTDKNIEVEFNYTPATADAQAALFRIGPLPNTEEDLIWVSYMFVDDRLPTMLEPLNKYLQEKPLDGYPTDYSKGMLDTYTFNDQIYCIPFRAGLYNLWWNKRIFEERGIKDPPTTPEELYEVAKKLTYTKPNGEKVYGMSFRNVRIEIWEMLALGARMYGGEIMTPDYKLTINSPAVVKFVQLLKQMVKEGIMPSNWGQFDGLKMAQEGQLAMCAETSGRTGQFNSPELSKEAGNWMTTYLPLAKEFQTTEKKFSDGITFMWAIGILKGSNQKDTAWEAMRYMLQYDNALETARNGNTPARISVLENLAQEDPAAKIAAEVFRYTRTATPPIRNINRIMDIIGEHVENAVLRDRDPQAEMDLAAKEIAPLM
jgi:ABC-type glycerol-3-phosphate transport system substrate-binding protein